MEKPRLWLVLGLLMTLPLWFVAHGAGASPAMVIRAQPAEVSGEEVRLPALREVLRQRETVVVTTRLMRAGPTALRH